MLILSPFGIILVPLGSSTFRYLIKETTTIWQSRIQTTIYLSIIYSFPKIKLEGFQYLVTDPIVPKWLSNGNIKYLRVVKG